MRLAHLPLLLLAATLWQTPSGAAEKEAAWRDNYKDAQTAARNSGKPIFLVFR